MRTQVGIIGTGPAGLLLAQLLHRRGIESVVLEARSRDYCENRIRAGLLEQGSVDTLAEAGVGDRLLREALAHDGLELRFDRQPHRIDLHGLTRKRVFIYGQQETVKDMIAARLALPAPLLFEVSDVAMHDLDSDRPRITFVHEGRMQEMACDVIAGCDGFHGICRNAFPAGLPRLFERVYPFAWLGLLVAAPPASHDIN